MEKLINDKFQKLNEFKIDNLDLIRGGIWTANTHTSAGPDSIIVSYSQADGSWTERATNKKDYGKLGRQ